MGLAAGFVRFRANVPRKWVIVCEARPERTIQTTIRNQVVDG